MMPTVSDYNIVLFRQSDGWWVARVPAVEGCFALMPTREAALDELQLVFEMILEEHQARGEAMSSSSLKNLERDNCALKRPDCHSEGALATEESHLVNLSDSSVVYPDSAGCPLPLNDKPGRKLLRQPMKPQLQIALALIWREGELLIARRALNAGHLPDKWEFPGGKVEANETLEQACVREAREEVGLEVEITGAREVIVWDYAQRAVILHPFDCRITQGEARALECAAVKWCAPADLDAADFPPANAALIATLRADTP